MKFLRKVGEIVTPWPCFVIATHTPFYSTSISPLVLQNFLQATQESTRLFKSHLEIAIPKISTCSHLSEGDAKKWFEGVSFSEKGEISQKMLIETVDFLRKCGVLKDQVNVENLLLKTVCKMVE
jgi:sulfonate transport system substrate-binding protein